VSCQQAWTERAEQALLASNSARSLNSFLEESQRNLAQIVGLVRE
jgi:hypothetical protein